MRSPRPLEEGAGPDHLDEPREVEERDVESTTSPSKCILCWNFRVAVFDVVKNAVPLLYLFMFDVDKGAGSDRQDAHFDRLGFVRDGLLKLSMERLVQLGEGDDHVALHSPTGASKGL